VWQATLLVKNQQVVLKVVFPDPDLDPEEAAKARPTSCQLQSFQREIAILARVGQHPNVAGLLGITSDFRVLVLEEAMIDLHQMIQSQRRGLALSMVRRWSHELLAGTAHLHSISILHRDLKPSNLLIYKGMTLRIGDYGLSCEADVSQELPVRREICTLWYRAPELVMGCEDYSSKIDVWSCGIIILEMLVGRCPTPGRVADVCGCPKAMHFNFNYDQLVKIFRLVGTPSDRVFLAKMQCLQHFEHWPSHAAKLEDVVSGAVRKSVKSSAKAAIETERDTLKTLVAQQKRQMQELDRERNALKVGVSHDEQHLKDQAETYEILAKKADALKMRHTEDVENVCDPNQWIEVLSSLLTTDPAYRPGVLSVLKYPLWQTMCPSQLQSQDLKTAAPVQQSKLSKTLSASEVTAEAMPAQKAPTLARAHSSEASCTARSQQGSTKAPPTMYRRRRSISNPSTPEKAPQPDRPPPELDGRVAGAGARTLLAKIRNSRVGDALNDVPARPKLPPMTVQGRKVENADDGCTRKDRTLLPSRHHRTSHKKQGHFSETTGNSVIADMDPLLVPKDYVVNVRPKS